MDYLINKILVFATRRNLELLSSSRIWFLHETLEVKNNVT